MAQAPFDDQKSIESVTHSLEGMKGQRDEDGWGDEMRSAEFDIVQSDE
jgi:hypothetical protein